MALTGDWTLSGDCYYRKCDLYRYDWPLLAGASQVVGAACGGPIAIGHSMAPRNTITICSSDAKQISSIKWNSGRLLKFDWSARDELVCIQADGNVLLYDLFGTFIKSVSMGKDASDVGILDGKVFTTPIGTTGVVVMTTNYRFYMITNLDEAKVRQLADLPGIHQLPPSCWCILNHALTSQILVARQQELSLVDITGVNEKLKSQMSVPPEVSFLEVAVSFDHKYIALYGSSGVLWLTSSDFKNTLCEFDAENPCRPTSLSWCGTSAVVAVWENYLLLIGVDKEVVRFDYDSQVHLVKEMDGVRIISQHSHELLQTVPSALLDVLMFGSESPGALLFEAFRLSQEGMRDAHEYVKMVGGQMEVAVDSCLRAALHELQAPVQKQLLRAASFGRCFMTKGRHGGLFAETCKKLRVLSALRGVAVPLTIVQLDDMGMEAVMDRLMRRGLFWLAFELVRYMDLPQGTPLVLHAWACHKMEDSTVDEDTLSRTICSKLQQHPETPFTPIINHAILHNKQQLALNLIDHDHHLGSQVPLLLRLNMESKALGKALLTGDSDLVYLVLLHWKGHCQHGEFLRHIRLFPAALSLYKQHCRGQNREMLMEMHYQEDEHDDEAVARVALSYEEERLDRRLSWLLSAKEAFDKAKNEVCSKLTEEQMKLLRLQRRWEDESGVALMHLSLEDTIRKLVAMNHQDHHQEKRLEVLRREFKVSEKRFWRMTIESLAEEGMWQELHEFSMTKKSPIGYQPFFEASLRKGSPEQSSKYLPRIPPDQLVKCYISLGEFEKAASLAMQSGREEDVEAVAATCQDAQLLQKLQAVQRR